MIAPKMGIMNESRKKLVALMDKYNNDNFQNWDKCQKTKKGKTHHHFCFTNSTMHHA
jgi:hypothetical protein